MMDFRQRLDQTRLRPVDGEYAPEMDAQLTCPYFGVEKTTSPACLDLRLPFGVRKAVPYSYFAEINFDVASGIEILTSSTRIKILGRNLSRIFDYLLTYRVKFIQAHVGGQENEEGLFVSEIVIEERDN